MIETSCPETRRVNNRRKALSKTWSGKAWKEARAGFILSHGGKCEWCGSIEHLTVHHPMRNSYGPQVYMDFALSECVLLCRACHSALHAGRVICTNAHEDGKNHYKWHDAEMCGVCYEKTHPEVREKKEQAKKERQEKQRLARKKAYQKAKKERMNGKGNGKAKGAKV